MEHKLISPSLAGSMASPWRDWAAVVSVAIGAFAFVTAEFLPVGLLPQIAAELGVSNGTAGLMVTTPGLLSAVSAPAMLLAAGRIDRRLILLALSVLLLASNLVSALAPNFAVMLVGRALLGCCLGGFWTVALASAGRLVREPHAAKATAMMFAGITFATVIGVPLGTFISSLFSWRAAFLSTGVLVAIALAAQAWLLPPLPARSAVRAADLLALLSHPKPRRSLLIVALAFAAHLAGYTYIAPFMAQSAGLGLSAVTPILLGFGIAGFVSNFAVSSVAARHVRGSLFIAVLVCTLCLGALPLLRISHVAVIAAVLVWGLAYGAIPLCLSILVQQSTPESPEAGSALFVSTVQLSIAVGATAGGVAVDVLGSPANLWLGAALGVAALVGIVGFRAVGR